MMQNKAQKGKRNLTSFLQKGNGAIEKMVQNILFFGSLSSSNPFCSWEESFWETF